LLAATAAAFFPALSASISIFGLLLAADHEKWVEYMVKALTAFSYTLEKTFVCSKASCAIFKNEREKAPSSLFVAPAIKIPGYEARI
jgi:hypothetical protein